MSTLWWNCLLYTSGNEFVHMLNGTALVTSRIPIAILENFQQEDGTVKIPDALAPYMGKGFIGK